MGSGYAVAPPQALQKTFCGLYGAPEQLQRGRVVPEYTGNLPRLDYDRVTAATLDGERAAQNLVTRWRYGSLAGFRGRGYSPG